MTPEAVLQFVHTHFSDSRRALVPLLLQRLQDRSSSLRIMDALEQLGRPLQAYESGSDDLDQNLMGGEIDLEHLGDVCDKFTILLNPRVDAVSDWGFQDVIKVDGEAHTLRLWVNWFIPVYFCHCEFTRGIHQGKRYQYGPLPSMAEDEVSTLIEVQKIMTDLGYTALKESLLEQRFPALATDLVEENASVFECLFSDLNRPAFKQVELATWWK